jgi:hypothetical protein
MMPETTDEQLQERERRRDIAEGLRGILAVLNSNKPLDAILDYITLYASRLLEADAVAIYRLQPETNLLKIQSSHGLSDEYRIQRSSWGTAVRRKSNRSGGDHRCRQSHGHAVSPQPEMTTLLVYQSSAELSVPLVSRIS